MKSLLLLAMAFTAYTWAAEENRVPAQSWLTNRTFNVNVNGATAENVIRMIGQKAGVSVQIDGDLSKRVSYALQDVTLESALQRMAGDVGFDFNIKNETLYVSKSTAESSTGGIPKTSGSGQLVQLLPIKFVDADDMASKLKNLMKEGEEIHVDKSLNSIVFVGSESGFRKASQFVQLLDRLPNQILIEAKIVETNNNFSRELGFQVGDISDPSMDNSSRFTGLSTPGVDAANAHLRGKYRIGVLDGRNLDVRLIAAETKGDAKVISRPKVVTINNNRALINSGLTFNVKTLTNSTSGSTSTAGGTSTAVTGGLERVEAGLQLGVLPSIVNEGLVRLVVDVNNSEADKTISVDGIPGITTNSANTSIIVENGFTAVIAGLIKQSNSRARTGVPFLSDIPVLGLLFRNDVQSERNNELMIFITPKILANPGEMPREPASVKKKVAKVDATKEEEKEE